MPKIKHIFTSAFTLYAIFFTLANKHSVTLFLFPTEYQLKIPVFLLILVILLLGMIIAKLIGLTSMTKYYAQVNLLKKQLETLEKYIKQHDNNNYNNDDDK
ncbi:MAG: lipopolysaccharide assembly protein LapA domain-containing protein [Rickettsiales endosymbiont of Dermacentor nuttalli]